MFCPSCGKPYDDGSRFCPSCGQRLPEETPAAQPIRVQEAAEPAGSEYPEPAEADRLTLQSPIYFPEQPEGATEEAATQEPAPPQRKRLRRVFSRIGWAFLVIYLASGAAQAITAGVLQAFGVDLNGTPAYWLATFLPEYLVGFPVGYLLLRKLPVCMPETEQLQKFSPLELLKFYVIAVFLGYTGNFLSSAVGSVLQKIFGISGSLNVISSLLMQQSILMELLFAVLIGPLVEELFFRKLVIDRVRPYGEKTAIVYSALVFGLFHGNLTQSVYAFAFGLVLGYVYLRSGKLHYSYILHMVFNFVGSFVAVTLLEHASQQMSSLGMLDEMTAAGFEQMMEAIQTGGIAAIGWIMAYGFYILLLGAMMIIGLVLLCINRKRLKFYETTQQLPAGQRAAIVWRNPGMLVFTIFMVLMIVATFLLMGSLT